MMGNIKDTFEDHNESSHDELFDEEYDEYVFQGIVKTQGIKWVRVMLEKIEKEQEV